MINLFFQNTIYIIWFFGLPSMALIVMVFILLRRRIKRITNRNASVQE